METKLIYAFPGDDEAPLSMVGGKGASLIIGARGGLPVPAGFILSVEFFAEWMARLKGTAAWRAFLQAPKDGLKQACDALKTEAQRSSFTDEQRKALSESVSRLGSEGLFAVRSSSPEEDLEGSSFAGGYETVLGTTAGTIEEAVKKAFVSCLDHRVAVYKQEHGFDPADPKIAVIVQRQVASDVAGVGFSLNPVTNSYDEAVINANWGLGETVVGGTATPDTYVVDKVSLRLKNKACGSKETSVWLAPTGGTMERPSDRRAQFALSDEQAVELARLVMRVEKEYGRPMDVEWAYAEGKLFLLQARPITAFVSLPPSMITAPGEKKRLYFDVTTSVEALSRPLSVAGTSLFVVLMGNVGRMLFLRDITRDAGTTIPYIAPGRMYVNVSNLFRLVKKERALGFLGILDSLAARTVRAADEREYRSSVNILKLLPVGILAKAPRVAFLVAGARWMPERTHRECQKKLRAFEQRARALQKEAASCAALADALIGAVLRDVVLNQVPLAIAGLAAFGKMKKLAGKDLADKFGPLETALPNNMTTEMGLALYDVSETLPKGLDAAAVKAGIRNGTLPPRCMAAWKTFIGRYGHRGPGEIDVAAPRYRDEPELLIDTLLSMQARAGDGSVREKFARNREERRRAYADVLGEVQKADPAKARRFRGLFRTFETFAGYRETHKFYLVFAVDLVRQRMLEHGRALHEAGRLKNAEQVFDLTLQEVDAAMNDLSLDLAALAKKNRKPIDRIRRMPTVIDSRGLILRPPTPPAREGEARGTPISPGVVRGRVKTLHSPGEKPFLRGEILVARATDPGWTPLFASAAAVVLEVGGMLQHGALVAREYGLPCVAGVENATGMWKDGTLVEVDGAAGVVRTVQEKE
ncbi:MAG TPA: PEP/pyruvate-binding domain-containing protein [Candidatus Binatia bacterium]|jgi:pyruvate,water dikinase|nr:PEP/pyruvate-binding domain-containing protein [Candidatus Binatia bacterium]